MAEKNISHEFRFKMIDKTRNYFIEEINQIELMSKEHRKTSAALRYIEHLFILASPVTGFFSISTFNSLANIPISITSFAVGIKIRAITAGYKEFKWIIKKKRKQNDKIVSLEKTF